MIEMARQAKGPGWPRSKDPAGSIEELEAALADALMKVKKQRRRANSPPIRLKA